MIYVLYQPDAEGSRSGPIVQVGRGATVNLSALHLPAVEVSEYRSDYGTAFHVVDGKVVPKE